MGKFIKNNVAAKELNILSVWHFRLTSYPFGTRQFYSAILYKVPNKILFVRELWRPLLQDNKTFAWRQLPKRRDFRVETVSKKSRNDLETETRQWGPRPRHRKTCLETETVSRDNPTLLRIATTKFLLNLSKTKCLYLLKDKGQKLCRGNTRQISNKM